MIIARLTLREHTSGRYLAGRTVSSWPIPVGTLVVLKRDGDNGEYLLMELASRECRVDEQALLSFVDSDQQ